MENNLIQLNKFLANAGIASRRKIADLVTQKRVKVNGKVVEKIAIRVNPTKDTVEVDGRKIEGKSDFVYIMLNKPKGIVSTVSDEFKRKTVLDFIETRERVYPVGRLDQDSSGLIILTNDGELANKLTHPKFETSKIYHALISSDVKEKQLQSLRVGIRLKEGRTAPAQVSIIQQNPGRTTLEIVIHEGRNRQIRRMCGIVGLNLLELERVSMGPISLGNLGVGKYRFLTEEEIKVLKNLSH